MFVIIGLAISDGGNILGWSDGGWTDPSVVQRRGTVILSAERAPGQSADRPPNYILTNNCRGTRREFFGRLRKYWEKHK